METIKFKPSEISGNGAEALEVRDWIESLEDILYSAGPARVGRILEELQRHVQKAGVRLPVTLTTPYVNTIPADRQPPYPGNRTIERRIKSIVRWNAMAMVVRANRRESGIGGHISTYASAATLYEVGFNHFFRGADHACGGDLVYFQGHASPGIYARAFLEGRLSAQQLENFRNELAPGGGLSSYPHPWLMPSFWQFPTVSMGLGPITAIYQARYIHYLEDRGLIQPTGRKVWAFLGDGETDEPEALGAITLPAREGVDNLIFVVNCNLQRLDGPVRGNGKIIQELEAIFRGAGWNVIKVLWGKDWDPLYARDKDGLLARALGEVVDGESLRHRVEGAEYVRTAFFGSHPKLAELVKDIPDDQIWKLRLGGHDPEKVYAAYKAAVEFKGAPTVILANTIKGYGLGESGEGKNITHQQKKLNEDELQRFRDRFDIPIRNEELGDAPFYRPADDSLEIQYLRERRAALGGFVPKRSTAQVTIAPPKEDLFDEFAEGTGDREVSTTMAFVRMLSKMLRDPEIGNLIVPIVPDEARTFGMESLFRQCGIYSHAGQLYEPVDYKNLLYYREAKDGQILEEGITEAGSLSSFIAAGTAHAMHGIATIPIFLFYSMFGLQRVGDLIWAAADARCRGFLVGGTSGRTTLAGEGLQHQDGHSHVLALPVPNLLCYDPAYAYEIAVIVQDGIRRMYQDGEAIFYYMTIGNENYLQPAMPEGTRDGILRGLYRLRKAEGAGKSKKRAQLFGSGSILNEVVKAQAILAEKYGVAADVWSVTSYKELRREALDVERWNMLHPTEKAKVPYVTHCLGSEPGVFVAASDYMKVLPDSISKWLPKPIVALGTDGFGRSDGRGALRDFFEVDARHVAWATLVALFREKLVDVATIQQASKDLEIDPNKPNPMRS
ncbi:MAG: pyruvate dehydrogenase (acetyl-transferring), homodimeric type [Planctomycetes bacterium]|nr:pyruvate dehydrogenase (acetyl-transferring), homodimeric type [Planctomycetota bacterium]MBI3847400.1 pyruvate dehydrogenase (acetyl-transferring), homodimeric type [Planctomycetota bacterium]